jgi:hypothetical protein
LLSHKAIFFPYARLSHYGGMLFTAAALGLTDGIRIRDEIVPNRLNVVESRPEFFLAHTAASAYPNN